MASANGWPPNGSLENPKEFYQAKGKLPKSAEFKLTNSVIQGGNPPFQRIELSLQETT